MIILIEAVDGCGKTTLAKKLCRTYKAKYIHVSKPKTDSPFLEYVKLLNRLNVNKNYVIDRCFHGERAYGPVFRQRDGLSDEKQFYLELLTMKHDAKLVYCWQGHNEIASAFITRGEKYTRLEHVPALEKLYTKTLEKCKIQVLRYRWSTDPYKAVTRFIGLNSDTSVIKEPCQGFIGHPQPDVLFIGDLKNPNLSHLPVFCSTSGLFLMKTLMDLDIKVAVVNSVHDNKLLSLKDVVKLNPKKVVFLGKNAFHRLGYTLLDFKPRTVAHPQYAKRFYGKDALKKYTKEIEEACQ